MWLITSEEGSMLVIGEVRAQIHHRKLLARGFRFVTCWEVPDEYV